ncbi:hypothetical protein [Cellulomonas denverensis]
MGPGGSLGSAQAAAGWLLGLLRLRVGSVLPGTLVHAVSNLVAGLIAA